LGVNAFSSLKNGVNPASLLKTYDATSTTNAASAKPHNHPEGGIINGEQRCDVSRKVRELDIDSRESAPFHRYRLFFFFFAGNKNLRPHTPTTL
ncbi:hypothetical protein PIB30_080873, partial [Stylosanthes scabra]|nr:hypothetical protein [Stylosanthes scabra]